MKINNIIIFSGMILVSLIVANIGTGLTGSTNDIPDDIIAGNITYMRAVEGGEGNTRFSETDGRYFTRTVTMVYIINVDITGHPTYTFSGAVGRRGDFDVTYDSDLDAKGINLQKMAAITGYAQDRWGYILLNKNVMWQPYSKGS